jgi:hypothetical protein
LPPDREDVVTMMMTLFDLRAGVERVIKLLEEDDEEEEGEDES